jgi:5-methylcytosine-specific restriction endonuclease McrA
MLNLTPETSKKAWRSVLLADPCAYCGAPSVEIDHIVPTVTGIGSDSLDNLIGSCRPCNRRKKSRTFLSLLARQEIGHNPENRVRGIHYDKGYFDREAA